MLARLKHDEERCVGLKIGNIVGSRRVFQRLPQIFGDLVAGTKGTAVRELLVRRGHPAEEIRRRAGLDLENVEARGDVAIKEIRLREA